MEETARTSLIWQMALALGVTALGTVFTWWVLSPDIGFDDANIALAYARNIAEGHGYVYNIGGERVEGSTSLLWTLIDVVAFRMSDSPETLLEILSFLLTALTIVIAMRITALLAGERATAAQALTAAAFLAFMPYFGWLVWSLMDTVLWVLFLELTVFLLLILKIRPGKETRGVLAALLLLALLLPITRPEGIAVTTALAGFYVLHGRWQPDAKSSGIAWILGMGGLLSFAAVTVWRLWYFGYPFPNTFYAKTSMALVEQGKQGLRYVLEYFQNPQNILLAIGFIVVGLMVLRRGSPAQRYAVWLITYLIGGAVIVYTFLGGDHFGSNRFFLFFIPIALPVIMQLPRLVELRVPYLLAGAVGLVALAGGVKFAMDGGRMLGEFAIAEDGRERGLKLNALPGSPSLGVIAAGGIRMTYEGEIRDLLGLNWVAMAHAPEDGTFTQMSGHQGFNTAVFWQNPPDIFYARTVDCPPVPPSLAEFINRVTDRVSETPEFKALYAPYCLDGVVFYAAEPYVERVIAETGAFAFARSE